MNDEASQTLSGEPQLCSWKEAETLRLLSKGRANKPKEAWYVSKNAKSDSQIQQEVLRKLKWDTRVEETEVGVTVEHGIVTLTGTLSGYAKKLGAQEAAHRCLVFST